MTRPFGSKVIALVAGGVTIMAVCVVAAQEPSVPASSPTPVPGPTQQGPTQQAQTPAPVERDKSTDPQSTLEFSVNLGAPIFRSPSLNLNGERYTIYYERPISPSTLTPDQGTGPVCNIRVIPIDPSIDPGMRQPGPAANAVGATQYQIRGMEGTCKPSVPVVPQVSPRPSK